MTVTVRPIDASGGALPVECVVSLRRDDTLVAQQRCAPGASAVFDNQLHHRTYVVRVEARHFGTTTAVRMVGASDETFDFTCRIAPDCAEAVLPTAADLEEDLQRAVSGHDNRDETTVRRALDGRPVGDRPLPSRALPERPALPGRDVNARWEAWSVTERAGLLNLFAKMRSVSLANGDTVWSHVTNVVGACRDRIDVEVSPTLAWHTEHSPATFKPANDRLHPPPSGHERRGSTKTREPFGNLQLTFSARPGSGPATRVDADVDEAAGFGHAEQVARNAITGFIHRVLSDVPEGTTHPYDIHQILIEHQTGGDERPPGVAPYGPCFSLALRSGPASYRLPPR